MRNKSSRSQRSLSSPSRKIRYGVVGLGWISQVAVLPAFKHAQKNSELVALFSSDPKKLRLLGKKYNVEGLYSYEQFDEVLKRGQLDAVYIALPNSQHADFTCRAAKAKVHVLCEKPMAMDSEEAQAMIRTCRANGVKLMIAYRLHFDSGNLAAIQLVKSGKIGDIKIFSSDFSQKIEKENIRLHENLGGGSLYDMGIYCINAARYLFQGEPTEVTAMTASKGKLFREVDETTSVAMKFPGERLATFTCSFGAFEQDSYLLVGTKGKLRVEPAYGVGAPIKHFLQVGEKKTQKTFPRSDQFAPELLYFSECVLRNREPEPSGREGWADLRIIEAIFRSAKSGKTEKIPPLIAKRYPSPEQEIRRPAVKHQVLVDAAEPAA